MESEATFQFSSEIMNRLQKNLKKAMSLNNTDLFKKIKCLLWIGEGYKHAEVAKLLDISTKTVYNWLWLFAEKTFSWLGCFHYQGRGRKAKLTGKQQQKLYTMITAGPEANGYDCGIWNSVMIAELIFVKFGVKYNPRYLCSLLKKIGLSFQKAKFISDKAGTEEHEKAREKWQNETWPEILKTATENNAVIIFTDEVSFAWWGSLSRTWAPIGKQPVVKTSGKRKGFKIFGAIEFQTGRFLYMQTPDKFNGETYLQFHKYLLSQYDRPVILIEDGAPYHKTSIIKEYRQLKEQQGKLSVFRLPSYSPDFNPIEKLWKNTKKEATHLRYFNTFEHLKEAVERTFQKFILEPQRVIKVMKKLRQEAKLRFSFAGIS